MIIRPAEPGDAAALAELAERTFRDTFAAANTPEDMELHCRASYGEERQGQEIAEAAMRTLVADEGGVLAGFGQLRWGEAPECVGAARPAEIQRLYVDRPWHGKGLAQSLMAALLDLAREGGAEVVWLGVWGHNPRAIAFYRKLGFVVVGEHTFLLGSDRQRDLVMRRPFEGAL